MLGKIFICPTDERYACSWEGSSDEIPDHFQEEHDGLIFFDNSIDIDLNVASENKLLLTDTEVYLVQTKLDGDDLIIMLRFLGPQYVADTINYDIRLCSCTGEAVDKRFIICQMGQFRVHVKDIEWEKLICHILIQHHDNVVNVDANAIHVDNLEKNIFKSLQEEDIGNEIEDDNVFEIAELDSANNNFLKPELIAKLCNGKSQSLREPRKESKVFRQSSLEYFNFPRKTVSMTSSDLEILQEVDDVKVNLSCTNCRETMLPPIYLCPQDHAICSNCQGEKCSSCGQACTANRSEDLENFARKQIFSCKYKTRGCSEMFPYNQIRNHEQSCRFCDYSCPVEDCQSPNGKGQFQKIKEHFQVFHSSIKIIIDSSIVPFPKNVEFFILDEFKGVFYGCSKQLDNKIRWEVTYCGVNGNRFLLELYFGTKHKTNPTFFKPKSSKKFVVEMDIADLKSKKLKDKKACLIISVLK